MAYIKLIVFFLASIVSTGCTSGSDSTPPTSTSSSQASRTDDEQSQTEQESGRTDSNSSGTDNDTSSGEKEVTLITESRARSIMGGSCIAADCHAEVDDLLNSPDLVQQLEDDLMPPPNQGRYTLNSDRRAELIKYFNSL